MKAPLDKSLDMELDFPVADGDTWLNMIKLSQFNKIPSSELRASTAAVHVHTYGTH